MFSFFRKKSAGKSDQPAEKAETYRNHAHNDTPLAPTNPVTSRASSETNEKANTRKDVVNLLIPETDYSQKSGVGAIFHNIMAGKKRKNKKNNKIARAESCREISPQKEMPPHPSLQRSVSDLESTYKQCDLTRNQDVSAPTAAKNITDAPQPDPADFVKALVLQKYANKSPIETKKSHVSLVYVNEPNIDEKKHAETLLREIAKSIDCTIDKINEEKKLMGTTDSKTQKSKRNDDPVYESIMEQPQEQTIESLKDGLKDELEKLLKENSEAVKSDDDYVSLKGDDDDDKLKEEEDKPVIKKSNLKPPRSDTEGCSDDDRSDCGKKRVTFRKVIVFDDGDEQTDQEMDSSFESLTSEESEDDSEAEDEDEEETDEDEAPDNDEMLGGVVVSRNNNENKTVISNINETADSVTIKIECSDDDFKRISSDNSDSGFIEISDKLSDSIVEISSKTRSDDDSSSSECSGSEAEEIVEVEETDEEEDDKEVQEERVVIEEIFESEESEESEEVTDEDDDMSEKTLVTQESKFQSQVSALTELADHRCDESDKARDLIAQYRKEIEEKDLEIESLKSELAKAYKESELVKQRSRSLEEELGAARSCSANLAEQLTSKNDETIRQLRADLEAALLRAAELESRVVALERERDRLQQDKRIQEQRAQEALATAEANTTKWRLAHESARSQAAARAERMLADCEWKMRELEKRAREAERNNYELTQSIETIKTEKPKITAAAAAEVSQLRGLLSEQQRSVQSLTLTLQKVETREEALKLEVHRLKELLEKECRISKEKENRHLQTIERLEQQHVKAIETVKAETSAAAASTRAALERMHAERTRTALAQLRAEAERDTKNADRKLREVTTRYENLKEELAEKRAHFEQAIAEANSKADWELLNLRHMLDKSDITYANNIERANEKFEKEKEQLIEEWTLKLEEAEEQAETDKEDARRLLEQTKRTLIAEKNEMMQKLKEQHKNEMDEQWERFMADKEMCLARMKAECRQEGEEERVKREKELLEEIQELRSEMQSKHVDFDTLAVKAAACGRTLAVTEQELREALDREKDMREKRSEDATKMKQIERASKEQVEHLTRKCACLRKLFDDIRARLTMREREHGIEIKTKDREIQQLRAEVARLTKLLMEQSVGAAVLGARTMADGCEDLAAAEGAKPNEKLPSAPRRKGGTKTPEPIRKRPTLPELPSLPPESRLTAFEESDGRKRSKSVDLPAVQVPTRIKQLEEKGIIH